MNRKTAAWVPCIVQWLAAAVGVWLIFASDALGYGQANTRVEIAERVLGPLIASMGLIAAWEATRSVRWLNIPFGLALLVLPPLFGSPTIAIVNDAACGILVIALAVIPYPITHRFGGGWRSVFLKSRATA